MNYFSLTYEKSVNQKLSIVADVDWKEYYGHTAECAMYIEAEYYGLGFTMEGRYYPFRDSLSLPYGFFVGSFFKVARIVERYEEYSSRVIKFYRTHYLPGIGIDLGYAFGFKQIRFEPIIGYGFSLYSSLGTDNFMNPSFRNPPTYPYFIRLKLNVGYVF